MLVPKLQHNFSEQLIIWSEHVQGSVQHLDQVGSVHQEALTVQ